MFVNELELFSTNTISLPLEVECSCSEHSHFVIKLTPNHKGSVEIVITKELKVSIENKVYLETYYHHRLNQV